MPADRAKVGWALCDKKQTDFILFKFSPADCKNVFLVSYQLLRMAFRQQRDSWSKCFKVDVQTTCDRKTGAPLWQSEAVFVPSNVLYAAMIQVSVGLQGTTTANSHHQLFEVTVQ
jgi:hypothetical protein